MSGTVTKDLENLCDREFEFACREAYDRADRKVAEIKESMNSMGAYASAGTGQAVANQVLSCFDRVLHAFEEAYVEKWRRDGNRSLDDDDETWLVSKVTSQLEPQAREVEDRVHGYLWEESLFFRRFWEQAGIEAGKRCTTMRDKIRLLKMQKAQAKVPPTHPTKSLENPFEGLANPNDSKVAVLLAELTRCFESECWNASMILMRILLERAVDAIEPACRGKRGLGAKIDFCISASSVFGQSMSEVLKSLKATKLTGDIIAHDSALVVERTDVVISAPYFRLLISFWAGK